MVEVGSADEKAEVSDMSMLLERLNPVDDGSSLLLREILS